MYWIRTLDIRDFKVYDNRTVLGFDCLSKKLDGINAAKTLKRASAKVKLLKTLAVCEKTNIQER